MARAGAGRPGPRARPGARPPGPRAGLFSQGNGPFIGWAQPPVPQVERENIRQPGVPQLDKDFIWAWSKENQEVLIRGIVSA